MSSPAWMPDLAGHHGMMHLAFAEYLEKLCQLSNAQPLNEIDILRERRVGFICERDGDDLLNASGPGGLRE